MLREIHIRNFSIIDDLNIEFGKGLNVLTGETGAGKSIIINALSLALGERAAGDIIRKGEKEALVEASFDIPQKDLAPSANCILRDSGISDDEGLLLKRIISSQGRNRAYINSSMANLQSLSEVSSGIIDIHGQYEHQSLLSTENQLDLLDEYGGLAAERDEVGRLFGEMNSVREMIASLVQKEKERAQRLDILEFQINEIEAAGLRPGEEEALTDEIKIQSSAVHLAELANSAYEDLYSADASCIATLSKVLGSLREISGIDSGVHGNLKSAEEALTLLEETGYFLRDYKDRHEFDPDRLDQAQERLELIGKLKRKYGDTIREVLDFKDRSSVELEELRNSEERLGELKDRMEELKNRLAERAGELSKKRKRVAKKVESEVMAQLSELSMSGTGFLIEISFETGDDTPDGLKATSRGIDRVEFMISPNIGEDPRPLTRTASGGELSRIMLALKVILAKGDRMPVLVFDEIDTGVGGRTADAVARKLKGLSLSRQVICITHLPQIASYADEHLKIEKKTDNKRTRVEIKKVEKNERAEEIARMLSGKISEASLKHAGELLRKGQ